MDKYEYNVKSDQIKKLYSRKEYEAAAKIADEIDWVRVKDNTMINRVADIYENMKQYDKAKEVLLIAYERSPLGRQLAYKLTILALRTKNFVEADEFYQDFVEMSPSDVTQYLLKYRIAKAKGEDIEVLIRILEAYVEVEMDERWQYELAKLYHEAGEDDKCIAMCDELELWFNDGKYVEKAKELRKLITGVLSEYNKRYANESELTPSYSEIDMMAFEDNASGNEADSEIAAFAKALVEAEENEENQRISAEVEMESEEDEFENLDDSFEEEDGFLDDEISSEESKKIVVDEAAREVARMANAAESVIPVMTEEERMANEALKAAEEAALEAQKAAEMAKRLVEEARAKALQAKNVNQTASSVQIDAPKSSFSGMNAEQISKALEEEDLLKGGAEITSRRDSMIEIFEFDKSKDGKCNNIGEELTKTAEIDIEEINFKLEDTNNLYNTANIQEALAKSMEKILDDEKNKSRNAFSVHIDDDEDEIRPSKLGDTGYVEEPEEELTEVQEEIEEPAVVEVQEEIEEPAVADEVTEVQEEIEEPAVTDEVEEVQEEIEEPAVTDEVEEVQEEIEEPAVTDEVTEVQEEIEEPAVTDEVAEVQETIEKSVIEEDDSYLDDEDDKFEADEPTKRIDRDEINRILNASKNIYQTVPLSATFAKENNIHPDNQEDESEEEQIRGQMTIDEVLAEYERIEAEKEAEDLRILEENAKNMEASDEISVNKTPVVEAMVNEVIASEVSVNDEVKAEPKMEEVSEHEVVEIEEISEDEEIQEIVEESLEDVKQEAPQGRKIPDEYRSLFNDFVGTGSMEEDIAETLDNLINKFSEDGTSKTNNVIITGSAKIGKTTLGLSLIKAANRGRNRSGRRVAKVKASALNKRGVTTAMSQILGTDLIIEQAGNLMPNTLVDLMIAMKNYTEEMLIILEDDEAAIDRMLNNTPDLKNFFTNRLDIREMEIDDMVKIAKDYAAEEMYTIDEIGELALYAKLDDISGRNPVLSIEDIQEVIDDAIEHANRFSIGKLFGRRKAGKGEMGVLTEQDFM